MTPTESVGLQQRTRGRMRRRRLQKPNNECCKWAESIAWVEIFAIYSSWVSEGLRKKTSSCGYLLNQTFTGLSVQCSEHFNHNWNRCSKNVLTNVLLWITITIINEKKPWEMNIGNKDNADWSSEIILSIYMIRNPFNIESVVPRDSGDSDVELLEGFKASNWRCTQHRRFPWLADR